MNAEVKQTMSEANTSLSIGIGGIAMASYLVALLTWFPAGSVGQPLWLLNCLEIAVSLMFAYFGLRNFWRVSPRITSSAWNVEAIELYPYVKYASYQLFSFRTIIYGVVLWTLSAPINWPRDVSSSVSTIKIIAILAFLPFVLKDYRNFKKLTSDYKRRIPEHIRKEDKRLTSKANVALFSALIFNLVVFIAIKIISDFGNTGSPVVNPDLSGFLVLAALIPLTIHLLYARRITRQSGGQTI